MMLAAFYGGLALIALWATWRDEDLRWLGIWLVAGWAISNLLAAFAPVTIRPGPYTMIEMMVALSAYCAWGVHRRYSLPLIGIVIANTASISANVAFAWNFPPVYRQIHLFEVTTNLCFAAQCLLAAGTGVADGYRVGRFTWRPHFRGRSAQPHVRREEP